MGKIQSVDYAGFLLGGLPRPALLLNVMQGMQHEIEGRLGKL